MGTFEKLGVLVIVVIIVMILAVAIYQWGGPSGDEPALPEMGTVVPPPLEIKPIDKLKPKPDSDGEGADLWSGGLPKRYTVQRNDMVWKLVVNRWRLKESFVQAIATANPGFQLTRLQPGDELVIPDPSAYRRRGRDPNSDAAPPGTRRYEVQIGDTLEHIAKEQLGKSSRAREIQALNPELKPRRMPPGKTILIPAR